MIGTLKNTSSNRITKRQLEIINRKTIKYPLQIAEKDYFLALVVQFIYNSPLKSKLIFKGGTALFHCYLSQKRFSEDIDFTSLDSRISLEEIRSVLESDGTFRVNKSYQSKFTIKIERLQYQGLLGQPGNIKLEIDYYQNVVLPGITTDYHNVWNILTTPVVMDPLEICAEKIRAVSQRARYRDFYDLYFLLHSLGIDLDESLQILRKKEIRSPIISANIAKNWSIAKEQSNSDLGGIYCSEKVPSEAIETLIRNIVFDDLLDDD